MKRLLLVITLIAVSFETGLAQKTGKKTPSPSRRIVVAFYDDSRLNNPDGQAKLQDFRYFLKTIQEIAKKDFSDVEFKVVGRGELVKLPDYTNLNVQTMQPPLGYALVQTGTKRRILTGVQTDSDFACAAAAYFKRKSSACPK